jgi:hypothetical protein
MLKSMRNDPNPQPPAAASAWMMPSEVALFGSVEMSVFHGFAASKSRPGRVVVETVLVVVLVAGRVVDDVVEDEELLEVVGEVAVEVEVEVEVELVVGFVLEVADVELVLVEVVCRVVDVVEVEVVVVLFFRVLDAFPQPQVVQGSPPAQSAALSHCSPTSGSSRPSPQTDAAAVKRRRFVARAANVALRVPHAGSSTFA